MAERPNESGAAPPDWTQLNCLTSAGRVIFASDDWFAAAENLLQDGEPVWREGFTEQGKWMDGWESRRKRIEGHDWCVIELGLPGTILGLQLDTSFFTGNYAPRASVQGTWLEEAPAVVTGRTGQAGAAASPAMWEEVAALRSEDWPSLMDRAALGSGYRDTCNNYFPSRQTGPVTHIRLNIFPDGGVARLRAYGMAAAPVPAPPGPLDLLAARLGGLCLGYSDAHYGHPRNLIRAGAGCDMGDGWETARRLDRPSVLQADSAGILQVPGKEWAIFRLGLPGRITAVIVDTNHFKVCRHKRQNEQSKKRSPFTPFLLLNIGCAGQLPGQRGAGGGGHQGRLPGRPSCAACCPLSALAAAPPCRQARAAPAARAGGGGPRHPRHALPGHHRTRRWHQQAQAHRIPGQMTSCLLNKDIN